MVAQEFEEIGRVLVDNNVRVGYVNSEAVRQELFAILLCSLSAAKSQADVKPSLLTLSIMVLRRTDRFFSDAWAKGTSTTSDI